MTDESRQRQALSTADVAHSKTHLTAPPMLIIDWSFLACRTGVVMPYSRPGQGANKKGVNIISDFLETTVCARTARVCPELVMMTCRRLDPPSAGDLLPEEISCQPVSASSVVDWIKPEIKQQDHSMTNHILRAENSAPPDTDGKAASDGWATPKIQVRVERSFEARSRYRFAPQLLAVTLRTAGLFYPWFVTSFPPRPATRALKLQEKAH